MTTILDPLGTVTHDAIAERTVLAACLNEPSAINRARRSLTPDSFWHAGLGRSFAAMIAVDDRNQPVTPFNVYEQYRDDGNLGNDGTAANLIHDLYAYPYLSGSDAVARVAKLARHRQRSQLALRFAQVAADATDPDDAADAWARMNIDLELLIDDHDEAEPVTGLSTWDEFLARPPRESDWVVPSLLSRQEAVMVLAAAGVGKSWLSRQVALTIASGVHPFHAGQLIEPRRTLLIDLENPESTVARQTHSPYAAIQRLAGGKAGDRGHLWLYPAGLNIRKRPDAALLERVVDETRPDLVCVGSLYNLFARGSSDWDTAAEEAIAVLNKVRARFGCAWWIEHHMPRDSGGGHRQSPFGSSLWERWPSFGRVISRIGPDAYEFAVFRGDREAGREFPPGLKRGGKYVWTPIWNDEEVERIKAQCK